VPRSAAACVRFRPFLGRLSPVSTGPGSAAKSALPAGFATSCTQGLTTHLQRVIRPRCVVDSASWTHHTPTARRQTSPRAHSQASMGARRRGVPLPRRAHTTCLAARTQPASMTSPRAPAACRALSPWREQRSNSRVALPLNAGWRAVCLRRELPTQRALSAVSGQPCVHKSTREGDD
jgi:hypothetical protein